MQYKTVQSDEILSITILASDQVNNSREAVWVLESPNGSTVNNTLFHLIPEQYSCNLDT